MKEKVKSFYDFMKPHLALFMVTILVVSLLSHGAVAQVKAADVGSRTAWAEQEGVKGKSFTKKGVTTQESYTEYVYDEVTATYVPNTVSINSAAELGSRENPYAIETEEDLILFGQMSANDAKGKYFILTAKEYDMKGDSLYMLPLFPSAKTPSMMDSPDFQGTMIGNHAVIKNACIVNSGSNGQKYMAGLFSYMQNASVWDLNLSDAIFLLDSVDYIGGMAGYGPNNHLVNCDLEYAADYSKITSSGYTISGLIGWGNGAKIQDCNVTLKNITENKEIKFNSFYYGWYTTITNCSTKIVTDNFTITTKNNETITFSSEEGKFATINTNTETVWIDDVPIQSDSNSIIVYEDGSFAFGSDKEATISGNTVDATKVYSSVTVNPNYENAQTTNYIVESGTSVEEPGMELRTGYRFGGWSVSDNSTEACTFPYIVNGSVDFVALWTELDFTVPELVAVEGTTSNNVTLEQKESLVSANEILHDYYGNGTGLTNLDLFTLRSKIDNIARVQRVISNVETVIESIANLPQTITSTDTEVVKEVQTAYEALTDYEKTLVDSESLTNLEQSVKTLEALDLLDDETITNVAEIDETTVTLEDKENLQAAKTSLENSLSEAGKLSEKDKAIIQTELERITKALKVIEKVEEAALVVETLDSNWAYTTEITDVQAAIEKRVKDIDEGVIVTSDGLSKNAPTEESTGSISGTVTLRLNSISKDVTINLTLDKITPNPAKIAKEAVEAYLATITATNDTDLEKLHTAIIAKAEATEGVTITKDNILGKEEATYDKEGHINGRYTLEATGYDGVVLNVNLTIPQLEKVLAESVTLDKKVVFLEVDGTETLTETVSPQETYDKSITWTSSDWGIAEVEEGVVTALSSGTATITATTANGKTAECILIVSKEEIALEDKEALQETKKQLENLLNEDEMLSDEEREKAQKELVSITDAIETIETAETVTVSINALPDTVGSADTDAVKEVKADYDALTDDAKSFVSAESLAKLEKSVRTLLLLEKLNDETVTKAADIIPSNVTLEDKEALEEAENQLRSILREAENLSEQEKWKIQSEIDRIARAKNVIRKVEAVTVSINSLPATIEAEDVETVKDVQAAYAELTEYEKSLIASASQKKFEDAMKAVEILESGNDSDTPKDDDTGSGNDTASKDDTSSGNNKPSTNDTSNNTSIGNNTPVTNDTPAPQTQLPQKNKIYTGDSNQAEYKITVSDAKKGTVQYVKPVKKKSKVVIPDTVKINGVKFKVTSIAKNAFKNDKKIKQLSIGKNVKSIGANAFYGCKKLSKITIHTKQLTSSKVGKKAFKGIKSKATIKVPKAKYKTYKKMLLKKGVGSKAIFKKVKDA